MEDLRAGQNGLESRAEGLGTSTGGRDHQHRAGITRGTATLDEARDDGGVEAVDEGERQVGGGRRSGFTVRLSLLEGANDPGNCHSKESTRGLRHRAGVDNAPGCHLS